MAEAAAGPPPLAKPMGTPMGQPLMSSLDPPPILGMDTMDAIAAIGAPPA